MSKDVLPDSRLTYRPDFGAKMVDWELTSGGTVRLEAVPIFCVKCGKPWGYVPKDNTVHATYICRRCYDDDPECLNGMVASDEQFCQDVQHEMDRRFGKTLDPVEIQIALDRDTLGKELEALIKDSPYPVYNKQS